MNRAFSRRAAVRGKNFSKYGVRTDAEGTRARTVDGRVFDSAKEARRYGELLMLQKAGQIRNLRLQPSLALMAPIVVGGRENINEGRVDGMRIVGEYRGDFAYERLDQTKSWGCAVWQPVIEDCKGFRNHLYLWKRRHVKAQYGIEVLET